jgi:hypothetical protein
MFAFPFPGMLPPRQLCTSAQSTGLSADTIGSVSIPLAGDVPRAAIRATSHQFLRHISSATTSTAMDCAILILHIFALPLLDPKPPLIKA